MYIKLIVIGKLKDKTYASLAAEFLKRLSAWKIEVIELKELGEINREAGLIEAKLDSNYFNVLLDAKGREFSSEEFAKFLGEHKDLKTGKVCFVIGGAMGLPEEFKKGFDLQISLSQMTFTHQMARVLLLEQIYRAFCILSGKKYHY